MSVDPNQLEFLALLAQTGRLSRERATAIAERAAAGESLDAQLMAELDVDAAGLRQLRASGGRELPEIPGYLVERWLGSGASAEVYGARSKKTMQRVALKVLKRELAEQAQARADFTTEVKLLKRLSHRNIVRCTGAAKWGGTLLCVLDWIDGENLGERLADGRSLDEDAALRVVLEVAEALAFLAEEGIAHRDVKPANIMLDRSGKAVLIDLGFAMTTEQNSSAAGQAVSGTVAYMAPERARGESAADERSDIYALGATLFHLLLGRLPFDASDDREVLAMQIFQSLASPELKGRGLSPYVQYFIEKMMAKDLSDRYQGFDELIADVRAHLAGRERLDSAATKSGGSAASGLGGGAARARGRRRRR